MLKGYFVQAGYIGLVNNRKMLFESDKAYEEYMKGETKMEIRTHKVKDFENAKTQELEVHYSRYIVSWLKEVMKHTDILTACNRTEIIFGNDFECWLESVGCTDEEIDHIKLMATNGKLELERSAAAFIRSR